MARGKGRRPKASHSNSTKKSVKRSKAKEVAKHTKQKRYARQGPKFGEKHTETQTEFTGMQPKLDPMNAPKSKLAPVRFEKSLENLQVGIKKIRTNVDNEMDKLDETKANETERQKQPDREKIWDKEKNEIAKQVNSWLKENGLKLDNSALEGNHNFFDLCGKRMYAARVERSEDKVSLVFEYTSGLTDQPTTAAIFSVDPESMTIKLAEEGQSPSTLH